MFLLAWMGSLVPDIASSAEREGGDTAAGGDMLVPMFVRDLVVNRGEDMILSLVLSRSSFAV
jgi:hypothetical protein